VRREGEESACEHCGGLVYADTKRCPQCGRFPIKLHACPRCRTVASMDERQCPRCGQPFQPDGDFL